MKHKNDMKKQSQSIQAIGNEWLQSCVSRGLSHNTIEAYENALNYLYAYAGNESISSQTINGCVAFLKSKGLSDGTIKHHISTYKTLCIWCNKNEYMNIDIDALDIVKASKPEIVILTDENVENMIQYFESDTIGLRNKAIISFLATSGLRIGELCSLNIIDLPAKVQKGSVGKVVVKGRGGNVSTVYLTYKTDNYIREYLQNRKDESKALFVAINPRTHKAERVKREAMYRIIRNTAKQVGIKKTISPHTLRNYTATKYLRDNKNIESVRKIMRHGSILTTQRYLHDRNKDVEDIVKEAWQ